MAETIRHGLAVVNDPSSQHVAQLLERRGFRIRGRRADCPHCQADGPGHGRGTVSFTDEVAFCHRCKWTGNIRTLSRELGLHVASETAEQKAERRRAREFHEWTSTLEQILSDELVRLTMIAEYAKRALAFNPNNETAWGELAAFYHSEAALMGALDFVSCAKTSIWLEFPTSREKLREAFDEARARVEAA